MAERANSSALEAAGANPKRDFTPDAIDLAVPARTAEHRMEAALITERLNQSLPASSTSTDQSPSVALIRGKDASGVFLSNNDTWIAASARTSPTEVTTGLDPVNTYALGTCSAAKLTNFAPGLLPSVQVETFSPPVAAFSNTSRCVTGQSDFGTVFDVYNRSAQVGFQSLTGVTNDKGQSVVSNLTGSAGPEYSIQSPSINGSTKSGALAETFYVNNGSADANRAYYRPAGSQVEIPVNTPNSNVPGYVQTMAAGISADGLQMVGTSFVAGPNGPAVAETTFFNVDPKQPNKPAEPTVLGQLGSIIQGDQKINLDPAQYSRLGSYSNGYAEQSDGYRTALSTTRFGSKDSASEFYQAELVLSPTTRATMPLVRNGKTAEVIGDINFAQGITQPNGTTQYAFVGVLDRYHVRAGSDSESLEPRSSVLVVGNLVGAPSGMTLSYTPVRDLLADQGIELLGGKKLNPEQLFSLSSANGTTDLTFSTDQVSGTVTIKQSVIDEALRAQPQIPVPFQITRDNVGADSAPSAENKKQLRAKQN